MVWIIVVLFVIGICLFLLKAKPTKLEFPYDQHRALFTPAERSFYGVLCQATAGKAVVFGKVRVGDVLKTKKGLDASKRQAAFNRISAKHFDFLLCNPSDLSVLAAIELDDSSHSSKRRRARDEFVDSACLAAKLKLHRFPAQARYDTTKVRETIFPQLADNDGHRDSISTPEIKRKTVGHTTTDTRCCPKCSSELVVKVAKNGEHKGKKFLACSAFPSCRYIAKQTSAPVVPKPTVPEVAAEQQA